EKSKRSFCKKLPARIWHEPSGDKAEALYANNLGAEEDRLALEHFDGDEERRGRIDAAREQNKQDVVPVKSAGDYFFAEQASGEDWNEKELGGEVETGQKRGDRRDDHDKRHRGQVALRFFVAFGEQGDRQQDRGKEHCQGQGHEKNGQDRRNANVKLKHGCIDRKSTRLNSSHLVISYAVFCLKKKI